MNNPISLGLGEMAVTRNPNDVLAAFGLGSCLGICMIDPVTKVTGLLHAVLPETLNGSENENPANSSKYVDRGIENLLAGDVRQLSDGGGEFITARVPVIGREKVALFNSRVIQLAKLTELKFDWRMLNGLPTLVTDYLQAPPQYAPRVVTICELDADGRIKCIHNVSATRKLTAIRPVD